MRLLPSAVRVWVCSCSSFVLPGQLLVKLQITEWRGGGLGGAGRRHAACTPCWGATLLPGSLGCCSRAREVAALAGLCSMPDPGGKGNRVSEMGPQSKQSWAPTPRVGSFHGPSSGLSGFMAFHQPSPCGSGGDSCFGCPAALGGALIMSFVEQFVLCDGRTLTMLTLRVGAEASSHQSLRG